jgi:hydroxymethylpyrimidine pyrophosphatase-like HAD family hydrolase
VVIDSKGYSTCFRVNRSQQTNVEAFDLVRNLIVPTELATSTNLGCIDFYPKDSGKKNCCLYLAKKLCNDSEDESILATSAICLCDDDNDLEMALACQHAYVPSVSSESMAQAIKDNPTKLTVIEGIDGVEGTSATELALTLILARF